MKRQIAAVLAMSISISMFAPAVYAEETAPITAQETVQSETAEPEQPEDAEFILPSAKVAADSANETDEKTTAEETPSPTPDASEGGLSAANDVPTFYADGSSIVASGTCGDNLTWTLDDAGTLTISGTGEMTSHGWSSYKKSIKTVVMEEGTTSICDYAFDSCSVLETITLPVTLESIGEWAFYDCISLTAAYVPNNVICIGHDAFSNCSALESVSLPDSLQSIGYSAFADCAALTSIIIPAGITNVESSTFQDCTALKSIALPDTLEMIGDEAFYGCSALISIDIPDSVTSIGKTAFCWCSALSNITLPDALESLGEWSFKGCAALTTIDIPDKVTSIGNCTFDGCSSLTLIDIPDNVTSIGVKAFYYCRSLAFIDIPDGVTSIGKETFTGCDNLTKIFIPKSVTSIGESAFEYCKALKDVYYSGTETDRDNISSGRYNSLLWNATWHYNSTGPQEPVSASRLYYVSQWDETAQKLTLDEGLAYSVTESTVYADGATPETLVGKYALVETDTENIMQITSIQPVSSQIGTLSDIDESSLTIDETVYPSSSDSDLLWDGYKGQEVLYHTLNGEVLSLVPLEENHGVLDDWDPDTGHAEIDGKTYPTNPLTDLSFADEVSRYLDHQIVYFTAGSTSYMPLIRVDGFYYPTDPNHFKAAIYHAQWLSSDKDSAKDIADVLDEDTPSKILVDQMSDSGELALSAWRAFSAVFDALDDPTSIYNLSVKEQDVYCALILDALEMSVSEDFIADEVEDGIKLSKTLISNVCAAIKADKGIDLNDNEQFLAYITDDPTDIQKYIDKIFKQEQTDLAQLNKAFKYFSTGLKVVSSIEDYKEYCGACYALVDISDAMIEVLSRAYNLCYEVYGATSEKTLAFKMCLDMITDGCDELSDQIIGRGIYMLGKAGVEYLIKEKLWKSVTNKIKTACPEVAVLQIGYKAGETISNQLFSTDDTSEQYLKMNYITNIESTIDRVYEELKLDFNSNQSSERATAYLAGMQLAFNLRDVDCKTAGKYIDVIDDATFSKVAQFFGVKDHAALKKSLEHRQNYYADSYFHAETDWIDGLKTDYPETGLYEVFDQLLRGGNDVKTVKSFVVACPVNVYVYDSSDNVVASVVDGRVFCDADSIMIGVEGDQKIIRLYDNAEYRLEYAGTDSGNMDITITEFDENENISRTVNYYDVPLTDGAEYLMDVPEENMTDDYCLINSASSADVACNYDSMENLASHSVKINSGYFQKDGKLSTEITACAGETIELNAYVPDGYEFLRWETTSAAAKIEDSSAVSSTMIMPDEDVTITAIARKVNPFPDVSKDDWFYEDALYVSEHNLMNGIPNAEGKTCFEPDAPTSRAMVVTILYRMSGCPEVSEANNFSDVENDSWYTDAVIWASENGIVTGYAGTDQFGTNDPITREQMAVMMYRYAQYNGKDTSASASLDSFTDCEQVHSWAKDAFAWANAEGLIGGKPTDDGKFFLDPAGNAVRSQAAAILHRYCENI